MQYFSFTVGSCYHSVWLLALCVCMRMCLHTNAGEGLEVDSLHVFFCFFPPLIILEVTLVDKRSPKCKILDILVIILDQILVIMPIYSSQFGILS